MRNPVLPAALLMLLLAGCTGPVSPAGEARISSDTREIGKPWPVLIGEFSTPFTVIRHNRRGVLFGAGQGRQVRYQLDYVRKSLLRVPEPPSLPQDNLCPRAESVRDGERFLLLLIWPNGRRIPISESLLPAEVANSAMTGDGSGLAFYEQTPTGVQLVYYDQAAEERGAWRTSKEVPGRARLYWSPRGRLLIEECDGTLTVYERPTGLVAGSVPGGRPALSPNELFLAFWRPDGRPGLLDLGSGFDLPLQARNGGSRPLGSLFWSPDGGRLMWQLEVAAKEGPPTPTLCLYVTATEGLYRYPLQTTLSLKRFPILLEAAPAEVARLANLIPGSGYGPLLALGKAGYLIGRGKEVTRLDLDGRSFVLQVFPDPVCGLSLTEDMRRLAIVTRRRDRRLLYVWRLPTPTLLDGAFADERDLLLGRLRLGSTSGEVQDLLGRALSEETAVDPKSGTERLRTLHYKEVVVTFARHRLVRAISISPELSTGRGVSTGSSLEEVYARYGRPTYKTSDYLSYRGLAGRMTVKAAFKLGADRKVEAVLIAGEEARERR